MAPNNDWQKLLPILIDQPEEMSQRLNLELRFLSFVKQQHSCAIWTGGHTPKGYGVFYIGRVSGKKTCAYAHRVSWVLAHGPVPDGMIVCHTCDNPSCVNPDHLFLGTQTDNMRDCAAKGRLRNGTTRLTAEQAYAIREEYVRGSITQHALAAKYGINFRHVSNIVLGKRWKGATA